MKRVIDSLFDFIVEDNRLLTHRIFHLVRYHFHTIHHLECKRMGSRPKTSNEIPFNGALALSDQDEKEIMNQINSLGEKGFVDYIKDKCKIYKSNDKALSVLMLLKHSSKIRDYYDLYKEGEKFQSQKDDKNQINFLEAKAEFERSFLKLFLSEFKKVELNQEYLKEIIQEFVESGYQLDFYEVSMESIMS